MFVKQLGNWENAKADCESKGSQLAIVDTYAKLNDLADLRVSAGKKFSFS